MAGAVALGALLLGGCSTVRYYAHVAHGESALLSARRPIAAVLADPSTDARLIERLRVAQDARAFASDHLGLPRNRSYTTYADLHRPFATWNVFAAPEFSLAPYERCYPVAGCIAYRGYYDPAQAEAYARTLRAQGLETWIGGVPTYSTLGIFADPLLNTMMRWSDDQLVGMIFHELAHQRLYVKGDTTFDESFATFVQQEGLRQWHAARGMPPGQDVHEARSEAFDRLVLAARDRLQALYASKLPVETMRARKREEIERLRRDYAVLRDTRWNGDRAWDGWMSGEINNATLLPFGLYNRWVEAFGVLFRKTGGDWDAFHREAARIARLGAAERTRELMALEADASPHPTTEDARTRGLR